VAAIHSLYPYSSQLMATTRNQGATDQTQDVNSTQANNHAQTPDQDAANSGAYAQSTYQNTQTQPTAGRSEGQDAEANNSNSNSNSSENSNILDTAVQAGKKWLDQSGVLNSANQVPQAVKEWGNKAVTSVSGLSTTQKVVGGALLLAGVAFLSSRGRGKSSYSSSDEDDTNYRSGGKSNYKQGSWAGYSGGKSASNRNAQGGSGISSYGTERRATSGTAYGRNAGSTDTDFGSGRSAGNSYGSNRGADSSSNYSADKSSTPGASSNRGSYSSGASYNSGRSNPSASSLKAGNSSYGNAANSNEEDYDA
jgi:hypothetical protein